MLNLAYYSFQKIFCGSLMEKKNTYQFKFRKWFKNGLKAQKLLAQGNTLGNMQLQTRRPVRAKALKSQFENFC